MSHAADVKPIVVIVPLLLLISGLICFFVLPLPANVRAILLGSDLVAAVLVGVILFRRFHG